MPVRIPHPRRSVNSPRSRGLKLATGLPSNRHERSNSQPGERQTIHAKLFCTGTSSATVVIPIEDTAKGPLPDWQLHEVLKHIDLTLADADQNQDDEPHPPENAVEQAHRIVRAVADLGIQSFPKTYVATYYGEIDLTWKTFRKLMRVIIKPNGEMQLYHQPNYRDSARGESCPITLLEAKAVADRMRWLSRP
jgi:hypothetical protein